MPLFVKQIETITLHTLTKEQAMSIYYEFEKGLDFTQQFVTNGTEIVYSEEVWNEIKRLENEINTIMSDIENQPSTQDELISMLSSELLDLSIVVNDARRYADGTPDDAPSYEEWKETFKEVLI